MRAVNGDLTLKGQMHDVVEQRTLSNDDVCAAHLSPCRPQTRANKCALESHFSKRKTTCCLSTCGASCIKYIVKDTLMDILMTKKLSKYTKNCEISSDVLNKWTIKCSGID